MSCALYVAMEGKTFITNYVQKYLMQKSAKVPYHVKTMVWPVLLFSNQYFYAECFG